MTSPVPEGTGLARPEQRAFEKIFLGNGSVEAVAARLGGAFVLYRDYMRRRLREQLGTLDKAEPNLLIGAAEEIFQTFLPNWTKLLTPVLLAGYLNGLGETDFMIDNPFLSELAFRYASSLGHHIHEVSEDALVRGYSAQVNRRLPIKLAIANVIDAFGVTSKTMRSLVNIWTGKENVKLSEVVIPSVRKERAARIIGAAINQRATTVGEQEAWNAKETAKQISWLYARKQGLIPETSTRIWVTAADELVCKYCGQLHKLELPIDEQFEVKGVGKFWSPPLHPNCRCEVKIKLNLGDTAYNEAVFGGRQWLDTDEVEKADNEWETQPRGSGGRFGARPNPFKESAEEEIDLAAAIKEGERAAQLEEIKEALARPEKFSLAPSRLADEAPRFSLGPPQDTSRFSLKEEKFGLESEPFRLAGNFSLADAPQTMSASQYSLEDAGPYRLEGIGRTDDIKGETEPGRPARSRFALYGVLPSSELLSYDQVLDLDGTTPVIASSTMTAREIAKMEAKEDALFTADVLDWNSGVDTVPWRGLKVPLTPKIVQDVIDWERKRGESENAATEEGYAVIPIRELLNTYGEEVTDEAEVTRFLGSGISNTAKIPYSVISEHIGVHEYLVGHQPVVIKLYDLPSDEIQEDYRGVPSARPVAAYRVEGSEDEMHGGRRVTVHRLVADGWMPERES